MRVLVNALSVTNPSGRHVLMGHMNQLREWSSGKHEFVFLYHDTNQDIVVDKPGFEWIQCPANTARWWGRAFWEYRNLDRVFTETNSDFIFTPAGVSVPHIKAPQVVFCQNPWCLVTNMHEKLGDRVKAAIQRNAYRRTMRTADLMIFNSNYMHEAYRKNANQEAKASMVVYQAISPETLDAAEKFGKSQKEPGHIFSVSVMAPHKGADILVRALRYVCDQGVDARLTLAGVWPRESYRKMVEGLVDQLDLQNRVTITGWISDDDLLDMYSKADVFCLLSRCESFGIPAIEAQSFGTPTVGTDTCAIPEIGGDGGLYARLDDPTSAGECLLTLLSDDAKWQHYSAAAIENSQKYRWQECSRPMMQMFDIMQPEGNHTEASQNVDN